MADGGRPKVQETLTDKKLTSVVGAVLTQPSAYTQQLLRNANRPAQSLNSGAVLSRLSP